MHTSCFRFFTFMASAHFPKYDIRWINNNWIMRKWNFWKKWNEWKEFAALISWHIALPNGFHGKLLKSICNLIIQIKFAANKHLLLQKGILLEASQSKSKLFVWCNPCLFCSKCEMICTFASVPTGAERELFYRFLFRMSIILKCITAGDFTTQATGNKTHQNTKNYKTNKCYEFLCCVDAM